MLGHCSQGLPTSVRCDGVDINIALREAVTQTTTTTQPRPRPQPPQQTTTHHNTPQHTARQHTTKHNKTTRQQRDNNTTQQQHNNNNNNTTTTTHNNTQQHTTTHTTTQQYTTQHDNTTQHNTTRQHNSSTTAAQQQHNHHNNHYNHYNHHNASVLKSRFLFVRHLLKTPAVGVLMDAERVTGAAKRRRQRRFSSWLRHERMTVAAESAALHHSRDGGQVNHVGQRALKTDSPAYGEEVVNATHDAPWGQKTPPPGMRPGSLAEPAPERSDRSQRHSRSDRSQRHSSGETPLLAVPSLADASAEAIDGRTLRFLLMKNLALKKREEDEEMRKVEEMEQAKKEEVDEEWHVQLARTAQAAQQGQFCHYQGHYGSCKAFSSTQWWNRSCSDFGWIPRGFLCSAEHELHAVHRHVRLLWLRWLLD